MNQSKQTGVYKRLLHDDTVTFLVIMAKQGFLFIFIFLILSLIDNGQTFIGNNIFKTKSPILFERFCVQNGEDLEEIGIANFDFKLLPSKKD